MNCSECQMQQTRFEVIDGKAKPAEDGLCYVCHKEFIGLLEKFEYPKCFFCGRPVQTTYFENRLVCYMCIQMYKLPVL